LTFAVKHVFSAWLLGKPWHTVFFCRLIEALLWIEQRAKKRGGGSMVELRPVT
jgi:hypothetical protein